MRVAFQFALEILLPLVAAFVIYRWLPQAPASVKGKLLGFNINVAGAFAGYFALELLVFSFQSKIFPPPPPPPPPRYEVWTVDGAIQYEDGIPSKLAGQTALQLDPPIWSVNTDGTFHLEFVTQPGPGNESEFPTLHITSLNDDYDPVPIFLDGKPRPYDPQQYHIEKNAGTKQL